MNDARLEGLPLVLETPSEDENKKEDKRVWAQEIELLEWLVGKGANDPEVLEKAASLRERGTADREKALEAAQRKVARAEKLATKKPRKKKKDENEGESSLSDSE